MVVCIIQLFQQSCRQRSFSRKGQALFAKKISTLAFRSWLKLLLHQGSIFCCKTLTAIATHGHCCRKIIYMQLPKIKCYRPGIELPKHHFFILSRGNNSGKPLDIACPNCFVAECIDEHQREQFYWLSYALWQGKHYHPYLKGSCVQLIRLDDVNQLFRKGFETAQERNEHYRKAVARMRTFSQYKTEAEKLLKQQLQVHRAMLHNILFHQNLSFKNH
jgi:hypothetical protein